ncbi:uncharacterized protein M6D78_016796 isoform 2-T2 [Vipera latastei]
MAGLPAHGGGGGGGKLSLKRRREERGGVLGTFSTNASWFENQELSDAEASWITLLRAVDPHLNQSNLEKFVNFPEFHPKVGAVDTTPTPSTGFWRQSKAGWPWASWRRDMLSS